MLKQLCSAELIDFLRCQLWGFAMAKFSGGNKHEGKTVGQTDLRKMQSHPSQGRRHDHLRKSEA
jgi:hypothetical protein